MPALSKTRMVSRNAINAVIENCARLAETHPFVWKLAWEAVHRLTFLLPHDQSYKAFRHFIAARPQGLFLDVGANDGISVLSFRKFSKQYRILGLEPNPALKPPLQKIKSGDPLFDFKMVGAGASPLRLPFFVPSYKGIVLHTFTSSSEEQVRASVTRSFGKSVGAAIFIQPFEAEIIRLDDLNVDPAIIKVDAEGFDYDVLAGLEKTIERSRPFIVTEIAATEYDKVKSYLTARRYTLLLYNINNDCFAPDVVSYGKAVSAMSGHRNFFAAPEEMLSTLPMEKMIY
ncbi:FkbM family methyltransferase [Nitrobacteraceae bacterium AZCC 2146]